MEFDIEAKHLPLHAIEDQIVSIAASTSVVLENKLARPNRSLVEVLKGPLGKIADNQLTQDAPTTGVNLG